MLADLLDAITGCVSPTAGRGWRRARLTAWERRWRIGMQRLTIGASARGSGCGNCCTTAKKTSRSLD